MSFEKQMPQTSHFEKLLQISTNKKKKFRASLASIIFYWPLNFLTIFTFKVF